MALRTEARTALFLVFAGMAVSAQPVEAPATHDHWFGRGIGTLIVSDDSVAYVEKGKHKYEWKYEDIQQLKLGRSSLQILTYDDTKWKGDRDRELTFTRIPQESTARLLPLLSSRLDQRFIAAVPDPSIQPLWEVPVKLHSGLGGSEGRLLVGDSAIVYSTKEHDASRSWRIRDIENVSSSGPFDLTVTTLERGGLFRGTPTEFRFQLKRPMTDERYQSLWRMVHRAKGLEILQSHTGEYK